MTDAVVITSGGLDSTVLAYLAHRDWQGSVRLLSFDYGQRHVRELQFAEETAHRLDVEWNLIDLFSLGKLLTGSALTGDTPVPEGHYAEDTMRQTVVPNRNMIMLACATAVGINDHATVVYAGMHAGDHPVYPDCRPGFISALSHVVGIANEGFNPPRIVAPFVEMTKAQIVSMGQALGVPFDRTWSCYQGGDRHCGRCGTCVERAEAFHLAVVDDPTDYDDPTFWRTACGVS